LADRAFPKTRKAARGAQGIAAEIPQDLHMQIRGIGAKSPVFCEAKNARVSFWKGSVTLRKK
jgi:hypothetical protein